MTTSSPTGIILLGSISALRPRNSRSSSTPAAQSPTSPAPPAKNAGIIKQSPRFQPDLSGTYEPLKCNIDCSCDVESKQCVYERQYAEMSSSSGVLGEDIVSFGKESMLKPQRAVFGCETAETGDLFTQRADGIIGLGRGRLSIMDQLVGKGVISDSFSLCYGGMDVGGGAMVLGGISPPADMVYSRSDANRSPYYNIELKQIHVAGKPLRVEPVIFDKKHGTILDSGTTYAYLPEEAFLPFKDAITKNLRSLKQIDGPDPNYKDICFSGAGSDAHELSKAFPKVDMVFGNGQKLTLSPENYLFRHSKVPGAYCLGVFKNGKDPTTLLGGILVRNTLVTYDRQNERIGFWKTNCSELWSRLHIAAPPPKVPSASPNKNSTVGVSPASSPSGDHLFPGQIQVGLITFDLSLNVTYSELAPHMEELAELIAHDLEVDTHQVRLLNFSSEGNSTQIEWAVLPAGSADSISNTSAMGIIARLTEHRVRLPEKFGNYQLLEWNVEPPSRRSWWQQHLWAVVVGILTVAIMSLLGLLLLHIWRRIFSGPAAAYMPVDAAVPEQELQPMSTTAV
ncbi:aspartic proteinase CDR1-like [Iris pallida]|uniref:Aspartic proteinase CDR1-like n=1 Tax=Iris pallida TaxID=29817 RepID=A0AAX6GWB8_IRIPA|nr:aspartic proteinase CDR1-like [Iris pallida]